MLGRSGPALPLGSALPLEQQAVPEPEPALADEGETVVLDCQMTDEHFPAAAAAAAVPWQMLA